MPKTHGSVSVLCLHPRNPCRGERESAFRAFSSSKTKVHRHRLVLFTTVSEALFAEILVVLACAMFS